MGWFFGIFGGSTPPDSDPLKDLDPKLREFLNKESPVKFRRAAVEDQIISTTQSGRTESATLAASITAKSAQPRTAASEAAEQEKRRLEAERPVVLPKESLFQDGRYAHIWKTYKPLSQVEEEGKSANERMVDVLEGYKARKDQIGKAALENCALEQEEWMMCLRGGEWSDRVQLCRHQVRKMEKCYNMQHASRFLRTLGYNADPSRSPEFNDAIQIHADNMYQKLLAHEAAVAHAKENGLPEPTWTSTDPTTVYVPAHPGDIPETEKTQWKEQLAKMPESERPFEKAALQADWSVRMETARKVSRMKEDELREIEERKKNGRATIVDYVLRAMRGVVEEKK